MLPIDFFVDVCKNMPKLEERRSPVEDKKNTSAQKPKRKRSPNFPCIDLEKAIERAKQVYQRDKTTAVPITLIHDRWDYKAMSGMLQQVVAALKAYGLIQDEGSGKKRMIRVSESARKILLDHGDKSQIIKSAALRPKVFANLWEKFKSNGIPEDDVLRHYLLWEYEPAFNEDSVDSCIGTFKDTIAFANLSDSGIIEPEYDDTDEEDPGSGDGKDGLAPPGASSKGKISTLKNPSGNMKNLTIPLTGGSLATLQVPVPLSKRDYDGIVGFLKLFEDTLVFNVDDMKPREGESE